MLPTHPPGRQLKSPSHLKSPTGWTKKKTGVKLGCWAKLNPISANMENEFMKRGYLLPEGCKDLADVLPPQQQQLSLKPNPFTYILKDSPLADSFYSPPWLWVDKLPPIQGLITVSAQTTGFELANLLSRQPNEIYADLVQLGVISVTNPQADSLTKTLSHEIICKIARKYGFMVNSLPEDFKGFADVFNSIHQSQSPVDPSSPASSWSKIINFSSWPKEMPPVKGEIIIPTETSGFKLANLLSFHPITIFLDLITLGVITKNAATLLTEPLDFEIISKIARRYGFIAKKAEAQ